ncbi:MAG: amidohydrolase [Bacteroidales bacterium]|nr:amidohydrolase [Bacteroidales bacterium]
MKKIKEEIQKLSKKYFDEIVDYRRSLHKYPELFFQEYKTSEFIASKLTEFGISFTKGIAKTGIVGLIEGKHPNSKVVLLRADIDALPLVEENNIDYKSKNKGVMHACGHDVHIASLLGTLKILNKIKDKFHGSIKFIFQPSEEKFPGGAIAMINEGVLENPKPDNVFGQHVFPELEVGKIGLRPGKYMASSDEIILRIKGKGGHGAIPHATIDPVIIASHILVALQQISSRYAAHDMPTVLSFGKILANGSFNIIPDEVYIEGTFRTFDETWRYKAHQRINEIAKAIAKGMGGSCEVDIFVGYPALVNDELTTKNTKKYAIEYLGKHNVIDLDVRMTAEDFAYFSERIPSCFYRLGVKNEEKGIISNLHTPKFNVDENCLETGMGLMAWIAINELNNN